MLIMTENEEVKNNKASLIFMKRKTEITESIFLKRYRDTGSKKKRQRECEREREKKRFVTFCRESGGKGTNQIRLRVSGQEIILHICPQLCVLKQNNCKYMYFVLPFK